ncbi:MAG TPA: hypothetical protein EYH56_01150 [Nanoarchaeota archaeon]|nr:hypothetical protein [Nanoarchaeota archaeon]
MEETFLSFSIILAFCIIIFQFFYFKKRFEETENELKKLRAVVNKISFDFTLERMLNASSSEIMRKRITELGEKIFDYLKKKYNLEKVTTYMEMKKRIEQMNNIPEDEKENILEFLENMIYIEYSSKPLSPKRREKIKEIIITMLRKMGSHQAT